MTNIIRNININGSNNKICNCRGSMTINNYGTKQEVSVMCKCGRAVPQEYYDEKKDYTCECGVKVLEFTEGKQVIFNDEFDLDEFFKE